MLRTAELCGCAMECLSHLDDLSDPVALSAILGPIRRVRDAAMMTVGFTSASHRRLVAEFADGREESFVCKQTSPRTDWTAIRTRDTRGREVAILEEPMLAAIWECMSNPYVACARESGTTALLMRDLSSHLLPDVRAPLDVDQERALLSALARLHARFWNASDAPPCLARSEDFVDLIGPRCAESASFGAMPMSLRERIATGWTHVARRAPRGITTLLGAPTRDIVREFFDGPKTIVHGDAKVANFAIDPRSSTVWAFDWAIAGYAPAGVDLGWYLSVNGSRIADTKDAALARYRALLEAERGTRLSDADWTSIERCAVVCGALMGLWAKAMLLESNAPNADREWTWWMDRLGALARDG
jgi:hypothetical protein